MLSFLLQLYLHNKEGFCPGGEVLLGAGVVWPLLRSGSDKNHPTPAYFYPTHYITRTAQQDKHISRLRGLSLRLTFTLNRDEDFFEFSMNYESLISTKYNSMLKQ